MKNENSDRKGFELKIAQKLRHHKVTPPDDQFDTIIKKYEGFYHSRRSIVTYAVAAGVSFIALALIYLAITSPVTDQTHMAEQKQIEAERPVTEKAASDSGITKKDVRKSASEKKTALKETMGSYDREENTSALAASEVWHYGNDVTSKKVTLPDSTQVKLTEGTYLSYQNLKNERRASLSGTAAFFSIEPESKPFIIMAGSVQVRVTGTQFSVERDQKGNYVVSVYEGNVAVSDSQVANEVSLTAGEKAVVANNELTIQAFDTNELFWATGNLSFDNASLITILKTLENYYKIRVDIVERAGGNCRFTGSFKQKTFDEILSILAATSRLTYQKREDYYSVLFESCQ